MLSSAQKRGEGLMQAAWNGLNGTALSSYFMSMDLEAQIVTSQGLELQFNLYYGMVAIIMYYGIMQYYRIL